MKYKCTKRALFIMWIKKMLGVRSPSAIMRGYEFEYDFAKSMLSGDKD